MNVRPLTVLTLLLASLGLAGPAAGSLHGQDRLPAMPGYDRYQEMSPQIRGAMFPAPSP